MTQSFKLKLILTFFLIGSAQGAYGKCTVTNTCCSHLVAAKCKESGSGKLIRLYSRICRAACLRNEHGSRSGRCNRSGFVYDEMTFAGGLRKKGEDPSDEKRISDPGNRWRGIDISPGARQNQADPNKLVCYETEEYKQKAKEAAKKTIINPINNIF